MITSSFLIVPFLLFSLLFAYVSHHICLVLAATPPHYLILPISLNSLDLTGFEIAESSWLTDYYNNSYRYRLCDVHDARAMFACFGVLLLLLLRSGDRFQVGSLG